jgi:hypothetical protein
MCDGDRYDDRVTEIVDAALEQGLPACVQAAVRRLGGGLAAHECDERYSGPSSLRGDENCGG